VCLREWGHKAAVGRWRPPWSSACSQSVVTRMAIKIILMKIYSRFKGTDFLCSMLANFVMPQRRDRGAMAPMGRRRPPWPGCIFLPSFRLANRVSEVCQPKTNRNPTTDQPDISIIFGGMGRLKYPSSENPSGEDACAIWLHRSAILGSAVLGEAADAMVELCFVCIYRTLT
jgi:hypothetical protein